MLDKLKKMKPTKAVEQEAEMDLEEILGAEAPEGEEDLELENALMGDAEKSVGALEALSDDELQAELEKRGFTISKKDLADEEEDLSLELEEDALDLELEE
jgi:hypothetical protein